MRLSCASLMCDATQAYDAVGATGGADYPVTDLLQMMGRASRPDIDDAGRRAPSTPEPFQPYSPPLSKWHVTFKGRRSLGTTHITIRTCSLHRHTRYATVKVSR